MYRDPFAPDEWYHIYNRGVEKRVTFLSKRDYERMQQLLYVTNSSTIVHRSNREKITHVDVFSIPRGKPLVDIAAYCLMPNHFHFLARSDTDTGITTFMQRLMTGYTMYFNIKYQHVGNVFYKPFRSKLVADDRYGQRVYNYIMANPWELTKNLKLAAHRKFLEAYPYGSLCDHITYRPETKILAPHNALPFVRKSTSEILADAHLFDTLTAR